ncbi:SDR family oxidoreductase [Chitinimonas sp.]|uniref:SDR family oxidoreductase n=1 Tax=Chitinimonas sp. TaxID=1934313 RepID=UPI002F95D79F
MAVDAFAGKTVWLTGASSGIGEALAYALAAQGARLVLSARRTAELERVRLACASPEQHLVLTLDVTDEAALPDAVARAEAWSGGLDCLILNAGVAQRGEARDTALAVDRALLAVNYYAPVALSKLVLPGMLARGHGRLVVISSVMGKVGMPRRSGYAAAKHALHGYFDSLRAELWPSAIGVTLVCPGFIQTPLPMAALQPDGKAQGRMDAWQRQGYPVARCARDILRGLARGRDEFCVGGKETLAVWLARFFPGLYRRMVTKVEVS